MFTRVETRSEKPTEELTTLRKARDLITERGYGTAAIDDAISEIEEHTCPGCAGPLDEAGKHGRCARCEDRAEAAAS